MAKEDDPIILKRRKPYSPPIPKAIKEKRRGWKATGRPKGSKNKKTLVKEQNKKIKRIQKNISEKEILITPLFSKIKEAESLVVALRGGARSSKSYSLAQLMTERFFGCPGRRIFILRKTLPSLRVTTLTLMREYMGLIGMMPFIKESKQTLDWKYGNTLLHFGSLDDPEKIKCFHPDTELLTKEGWRAVTSLKEGEVVASVNPSTFETNYFPIKEMHVYNYNGSMVSPISGGSREPYVNFCVTPEHKMLVYSKRAIKYKCREGNEKRWRFKEAETLPLNGKEYSLPISSKWNTGDTPEVYRIPRKDWNVIEGGKKNKNGQKKMVFPIIPWLKFLGWYLSEGCCDTRGKTLYISQTKKEGVKQFIEDMKDFPINYTYANRSFNFNSKDLVAYVKKFGLSNKKYIPRKVLNLHPSLLKHLFDALIAGDGRKESEKRWTYGTASKQLADDVCEIAVKLEYAVAVRKQLPKGQRVNGKKYFDTYIISIKKQEVARLGRTIRTKYKGKVYCPTIAPYHTCIIRYKGKVSISGQSSDWNDIWMEEATEFSYRDFMILKTRLSSPICGNLPNQLFLSFNPEDEYCWIKEKVIDADTDCLEIPSSYRDNPFLSDEYRKILEDLEKQDINYWRIYGLGQWGKLTNLIYNNWKIVDELPISRSNVIYGLDFGFNNPSALIKLYMDGNEVGVEEKIYETGLTTTDLISRMEEAIPKEHRQNHPIYADNAEPDRILEINNAGFWCLPCHKVSVTEGIDDVKQFQLYSLSTNIHYNKEVKTYSWRQDKNDKILDEPVKYNDHCFTGDTKILMADGKEVDIKEVKKGDFVVTENGVNKVLLSRLTQKEVEIYKITLSNNYFLKGTEDHQIYTTEGLVAIKDLNSLHQIKVMGEKVCKNKLVIEGQNIIGTASTIYQLADVLKEEVDYIVQSGSFVMEKYPKDMLSTIKMEMPLTTKLIISNLLKEVNILQIILRRTGNQKNLEIELEDILFQLMILQKSGMIQKKEEYGISSMEKTVGRIENHIQNTVKYVEKNMKHTFQANQSTAIIIAKQKLSEKEGVYNLTVENDHNYYANKILVKNCMDAKRYALSTYVRQNLIGRPRIREL